MNTTQTISNTDDYIDSRDIIARVEYLKEAWAESTGEDPDTYALSGDDWKVGLGDDEGEEMEALLALVEEASGLSDWWYGSTLIRDSYFVEYAQELAEDIGAVNSDAGWPVYCIDWEHAARDLQMDYTSVDFDGVDYWARS
jgi:hypothetical protein